MIMLRIFFHAFSPTPGTHWVPTCPENLWVRCDWSLLRNVGAIVLPKKLGYNAAIYWVFSLGGSLISHESNLW